MSDRESAIDETGARKKRGRRPKHGVAMEPSQRQRQYRREKYTRISAAMKDLAEASDRTLLDTLQWMVAAQSGPWGIHRICAELCARYPMRPTDAELPPPVSKPATPHLSGVHEGGKGTAKSKNI